MTDRGLYRLIASSVAPALRIAGAFFLAAVLISPVAEPWFAEIPDGDESRVRKSLAAPGGTPDNLGIREGTPAGPAAHAQTSTGAVARQSLPRGTEADAQHQEHRREMAARLRERARPLYPREE